MKNNKVKVLALAIAGAILPVISYILGATDKFDVCPLREEDFENYDENEEEIYQDTL